MVTLVALTKVFNSWALLHDVLLVLRWSDQIDCWLTDATNHATDIQFIILTLSRLLYKWCPTDDHFWNNRKIRPDCGMNFQNRSALLLWINYFYLTTGDSVFKNYLCIWLFTNAGKFRKRVWLPNRKIFLTLRTFLRPTKKNSNWNI